MFDFCQKRSFSKAVEIKYRAKGTLFAEKQQENRPEGVIGSSNTLPFAALKLEKRKTVL